MKLRAYALVATSCRERPCLKLDDKTFKVYYNINKRRELENKDAAALLEYIKTAKATHEYTESLAKFVQEVKMTARERKEYMDLQIMRRNDRAEGAHDKAVETARNFLALGIVTQEQIAQATGLPLAEVQALAQK